MGGGVFFFKYVFLGVFVILSGGKYYKWQSIVTQRPWEMSSGLSYLTPECIWLLALPIY